MSAKMTFGVSYSTDCQTHLEAAQESEGGRVMQGSRIAIEIATAILTVQELEGPLECDRAQMMCGWGDGIETGHGGRNKQSIVKEIDAVFARHGFGKEAQ